MIRLLPIIIYNTGKYRDTMGIIINNMVMGVFAGGNSWEPHL
jgi:hypothetical protein